MKTYIIKFIGERFGRPAELTIPKRGKSKIDVVLKFKKVNPEAKILSVHEFRRSWI